MKVYKQPCALCGKNNPEILFPASYKKKISKFENIVICKNCGLVYKYPVVPGSEIIHYITAGHWDRKYFSDKLKITANLVFNQANITPSAILDIGAASGHLLNHLSGLYPNAELVGVEPSKNACIEAKNINSKLNMINSTIEDVTLQDNYFDLITVIGVDYLFLDHVSSLNKIAKLLKSDGKMYLERNVFLTTQAYFVTPVNCVNDLFGVNSMMKNWFTESQMELQLSKFFDIEKRNRYVSSVVNGKENILVGWLCSTRKDISKKISIPNNYATNMKYIRHLGK